MAKNKIKQDTGRTVIFIFYFILFILFSFLCLYPLFFCFTNSLKTVQEFTSEGGMFKMPESWKLTYYGAIFRSFKIGPYNFWDMAWNSFWLAFGGQFLNILASAMVAYPLARYNFPFKKFFYFLIIFRITIPIIGAGAAGYKFMRFLGFINNPMYIVTYFSGFDMTALIFYGYFKGISKEYSEAAFIDGASRMRTLFSIILPQALPCILALYINNVMGQWNNYSTSQIYLPQYPNLALGIFNFDSASTFLENSTAMFFGAVVLSSLVPLALFTSGRKLMMNNMSVGGLKG